MAGGTWTTQNKVRPGVYVNFASQAQLGSISDRGVASLPLPLSWGDAKQMVTINAGDDIFKILGYDLTDPKLLLVREALKRASKLLLYRVNTGTKAAATVGTLTATARCGGVRGNDLRLVIQANVDDNTKFDVQTLLLGKVVDTQTVANIAGLKANDWIVFSGAGSLTATAGSPLTGGTDGTVTNQDYLDYLAAVELHSFQTIGLPVTDSTLKSVFVTFIKRLRDSEGIKAQLVIETDSTADCEGVINVKNGVKLADGTTLTAAQATAWVAGATARAAANESLTYAAYDGAVDVHPRYTNSQIEAALKAGELVFVHHNGRAIIEQDINSLVSFTPEKGKMFAKNRVLRVLDSINNDFKRIFETYYIGKVDNDDDGRNLFKKECIKLLETLQSISAIQNFDAQTDIIVSQGDESDSVTVELYVQPVDSIEKIYVKVNVR
ncbi:phage tail sheath family protein [Paenibacillus sp. YYML68]|uniref:phage tail sheath family protein n=1 Tax=Paenibacillus sp. YYML68 TaxID=2909250 RepID=UPI0024924F63|nr:phage tail sheath family protein [Paenibacillus sp. YYML68]